MHSLLTRTRLFGIFVSLIFTALSGLSQICVQPPDGMVAWWAAEGTAAEPIGNNNGTLQNGVGFTNGIVGQGFEFDGLDDYISVPANPNLNVGISSGFTIECWINPADINRTHIITEWNNASGGLGVLLCHSDPGVGGLGAFFANIVSTSGGDHIIATPAGILSPNNFQHLAVTYDKSTGLAKLFYNGSVAASQNFGLFTPQTTYQFYMGTRVSGPAAVGSYFSGILDELGVYNRALSDNEIQGIYSAGAAGKCTTQTPIILVQPKGGRAFPGYSFQFDVLAAGSQLAYQWLFNGNDLLGQTNKSLILQNLQ